MSIKTDPFFVSIATAPVIGQIMVMRCKLFDVGFMSNWTQWPGRQKEYLRRVGQNSCFFPNVMLMLSSKGQTSKVAVRIRAGPP